MRKISHCFNLALLLFALLTVSAHASKKICPPGEYCDPQVGPNYPAVHPAELKCAIEMCGGNTCVDGDGDGIYDSCHATDYWVQ